jgi:hypothetical protein
MRRRDEDPPELPHPRLPALLAAISDHFGGREIHIVSGRRRAEGYTRESSRHVSGRATDIRVRGVPRREVWDFCRSLGHTGCGYYPRSTFTHVDVRDRSGQWVDWSRPGRRPRYGSLRGPYRRRIRRGRRRGRWTRGRPETERVTRRVTRPDAVPLEVPLTADAQALYAEVEIEADIDDSELTEELATEEDEDEEAIAIPSSESEGDGSEVEVEAGG